VNETVDLSFLNAQGQVVQRIEKVNSGESIIVDQLAKGMYVIQINTSFGKELKRLIIE
jgi:predicted  nucleic acid-binding Zn-ribbon protein